MKKYFCLFLYSLIFFSTYSFSEVIETHDIQDLLKYTQKGTLIVLDINNVLIETSQDLGSDQWSNWKVQQLMDQNGWTKEEAEDHFVPFFHHVLLTTKCKTVEETTVGVIRQLQKKKVPLLGLTAQYTEMAYPTHALLKSVSIDLSKNPLIKKNVDVNGGAPAKYIDGIIFSGMKNNKGQTLKRFLAQNKYKPKRVVFIDDKLKNVKAVETAMKEYGVPCTGLRYSRLDKKINDFDPTLAEKQLQYFGKVLPEDVAGKLVDSPIHHVKGGN